MIAIGWSHWLRDWGALALAGLAAASSIAALVVNLLHHRSDWQRELRMPAYTKFAAAAGALLYAYQTVRVTPPADHVSVVREPMEHFDGALAEVLIVGPKSVADAADLVGQTLHELGSVCRTWRPGDAEPDERYYEAAQPRFITAASAAVGFKYVPNALMLDEFKLSLPEPPDE